jgi:hypothetical protein
MKKAIEYRRHADKCRRMAGRANSSEHRQMLLTMAATWDSLAADREAHIARQERLALLEGQLADFHGRCKPESGISSCAPSSDRAGRPRYMSQGLRFRALRRKADI